MNSSELFGQDEKSSQKQPIFNVPTVILCMLGLLVVIHFVREYMLTDDQNLRAMFEFAFIPARYTATELALLVPGAEYWSPVTYSFLHGNWTHLLLNSFWLLAFGAVVARRIGAVRFIILYIAGAIGGAALHYLGHFGELVPMIGASASVSACMGAAVRFAFPSGRSFERNASNLPRQSLIEAFSNRQVLMFVGIWFGINLIFGVGLIDINGSGNKVAWEAHIGGFLVGLLLFSLFDQKYQPNQRG